MPCECVQLQECLERAGVNVRVPGVRCGVCVDAILRAKEELVLENNALREQLHRIRQVRAAERRAQHG